ncbi:hypothetical protein [Candidatus Poriferisodalis sp.]|uniref:hypothetical protein n=1 Tax=Candidatus Poriferisodalis sp. TaxID=3101277 RepID=UPI003B5B655D
MGFLLLIEFLTQRQGIAQSVMLWLLLAGAVALTLWECRERGYRLKVLLWWVSFAALTHVVGYIVLRLVPRRERES